MGDHLALDGVEAEPEQHDRWWSVSTPTARLRHPSPWASSTSERATSTPSGIVLADAGDERLAELQAAHREAGQVGQRHAALAGVLDQHGRGRRRLSRSTASRAAGSARCRSRISRTMASASTPASSRSVEHRLGEVRERQLGVGHVEVDRHRGRRAQAGQSSGGARRARVRRTQRPRGPARSSLAAADRIRTGPDRAQDRVVPAHQGLDAGQRAVPPDERLVDEVEAVGGDRLGQVEAERVRTPVLREPGPLDDRRRSPVPGRRRSTAVRGRPRRRRPAPAARAAARCCLRAYMARSAVRRSRSGSSAGRSATATPTLTVTGSRVSPMSTGLDLDAGADALGDGVGLVGVGQVLADDHELVAAGAADGVGRAHGPADALGHLDEQAVAAVVAVAVVHGLERVEVAEQHGDGAARALGAGQGEGEPVEQRGPVADAGERIVGGLVGEAALVDRALDGHGDQRQRPSRGRRAGRWVRRARRRAGRPPRACWPLRGERTGRIVADWQASSGRTGSP